MMVGARSYFSAGHTLPQHPQPHGHSYEVWAYTAEGICAEEWQTILRLACQALDHKMLNGIIDPPTMENIARYIAEKISAKRVRVVRPVEGLCAEYEAI